MIHNGSCMVSWLPSKSRKTQILKNLDMKNKDSKTVQPCTIQNVSHRLILALDDYGRKVGRDSYGLPIDPDTKNFDTKHGKEMIEIVEGILNGAYPRIVGENRERVKQIVLCKWTKYNWEDKRTRPTKAGRYLIYRVKCDKMHFEHWNGGGWASSNNEILFWCEPRKPIL